MNSNEGKTAIVSLSFGKTYCRAGAKRRTSCFFSWFVYNRFMSISITPKAVNEVKRIMASQNVASDTFLRISILGGGCRGMQYALNFDTVFDTAVDTKYNIDDVILATQRKFDPHFDGTEIDFVDAPEGCGFVIENPNFPKFAGCAHCGH